MSWSSSGRKIRPPDRSMRSGQVLEKEPRVSRVEGGPFGVGERRGRGVAEPEIDQPGFAGGARQPVGLGELLRAALDADDAPGRTDGPGQRAAEEAGAAAEVEQPLPAAQADGAHGGIVEQAVHDAEPFLLPGRCSVNVGRRRIGHARLSARSGGGEVGSPVPAYWLTTTAPLLAKRLTPQRVQRNSNVPVDCGISSTTTGRSGVSFSLMPKSFMRRP